MTDRPFVRTELPAVILARARPALWPRIARSGPFAGVTLLAVASVAIAGNVTSPVLLTGGLVVAIGVTLGSLVVALDRLPTGAAALAAVTMIIALGLIREGAGGTQSGHAPLFLVPLLWLTLVGTRRSAVIGLLTMIAALAIPMIAGPPHPPDEWRRLIILLAATGFTVALVRRLVERTKLASDEIERQATRLTEQVALTRAVLDAADDMIVSFGANGRIVAVNSAVITHLGWSETQLIGHSLFDTIVAPGANRGSSLGPFAASDGSAGHDGQFEAEFRFADGGTVPVEISLAITGAAGATVTHAFARDISTRRQADEATQEHLNDLARLLSVARDLGLPTSAMDGRDAICAAARELAGGDLALFFEADPEHGLLMATGTAGDSNITSQITLDTRSSLTARVLAASVPEFVPDMSADERVDRGVARQMHVRAAFFQPVVRDGQPIGVLVVYWREPRPVISERIRSLLGLFATQAAAVVERADLMGRLERLARTDSLTGLANRRALEEALVAELSRAERSGQPLSVVMLDIDHFKAYNDERGHQAGDDLLRELAAAWSRELRPTDILARFGGEEFLAVLPASDTTAAGSVADRLRMALPTGVTASAGVATWGPHETMADLVARADAALYTAKGVGRNRTEIARTAGTSRAQLAQRHRVGSSPNTTVHGPK